ncbi:MAG: 4Fe-4S dicluster domain-containing protein [Myxococcales bacterium]
MLRAAGKHAFYVGISWLLAHVFLALFVSADELRAMIVHGPAEHGVVFAWAMAITFALYANFAWFREQLCVVVCPYGRLQSAMQDDDSLIVGYDERRGEPRGKRVKPGTTLPVLPRGDCIDCRRCVAVCPTGIDIRRGLQMECLACAQCVDACDEVMRKIERAPGLIRYDSLNALRGRPHRVLRGRLVLYAALFALSSAGLLVGLWSRAPFEANALRAGGVPYVLGADATVRNQFELHLVNKRPDAAILQVAVLEGAGAEVVIAQRELALGSLESARVPVFVTARRDGAVPARFPLLVLLQVGDGSGALKQLELQVLGPPSAVPGA